MVMQSQFFDKFLIETISHFVFRSHTLDQNIAAPAGQDSKSSTASKSICRLSFVVALFQFSGHLSCEFQRK